MHNTLLKGIVILEALAGEAREFSLAELAALTGLGKSQACRLLKTLVEQGYVVQNAGTRSYRIGLRTLELSASILERMEVRRAGLAYLHDLSDRTRSPSYLGVGHLGKVLIVETAYPAGVYSASSPGFGSTLPLHDSAMGRAMLAEMSVEERLRHVPGSADEGLAAAIEEARRTGVAVIVRERGDGSAVVGVAAVVRNCRGQAIAALGASTDKEDWDRRDQEAYKRAVAKAAAGLSFALGYAAGRLTLEGLSA